MGFFEAAKKFVTDPENIARAKALATEQNVDLAAGKLKQLAPEQIRGAVDGLAAKAKEWGGSEEEKPAAASDGKPEAGPGKAPEQPAAASDAEPESKPDGKPDAEPGGAASGEASGHQGEVEARA